MRWARKTGVAEVEDISDAIACVEVYLELLGLTWHSDRVVKYLENVGVRRGEAIRNKHYLPADSYRILAKKLKETHER